MINKFIQCLAALFVLLLPFSSYADQKFAVAKSSEINFIAKITGGSFTTKSQEVIGYVILDDAGKKIVSAEITVPVNSLDSDMSTRDDHMQNKYLEAGKFPNIVFSIKDAKIDFQPGASNKIPGEFSIKDVKKPVFVEATIKQPSNTKLEIKSDLPISITDYGIPQPTFAVVKMDTTVNVHVDLKLEQKP